MPLFKITQIVDRQCGKQLLGQEAGIERTIGGHHDECASRQCVRCGCVDDVGQCDDLHHVFIPVQDLLKFVNYLGSKFATTVILYTSLNIGRHSNKRARVCVPQRA